MALSDEINQLATAVTGAGTAIHNKDTAEATTRGSADTAEATARANADTAEQTARSQADAAEALARSQADAALQLLLNGAAQLKVGRFVGSAAELTAEQSAVPSQATVFNTWYRYSHGTNGLFPSVASELTAWAYDTATNRIHDTLNSTTTIGVVSPVSYSDYTLDVNLSSTNTDDDIIGVLLAWYKDPTTGQEYTLSAVRSPGGGSLWAVIYNHGQGAANGQKTIKDMGAAVQWGNGQPGTLSAAAAGYVTNTSTTGWSGQATLYGTDGHTRIQAVRAGNTITLQTTNFSAPDTFLSGSAITVDLTSDPVLAKFMGSSPYGFMANSQQDSYWSVNQFTNTKDTIFNLATGTAYQNVGGTWQTTTAVNWASIGTNVLLVNVDTGKIFFVKDQNNVLEFRAPWLISNGSVLTPEVDPIGNYRGVGSVSSTGSISGDYWGSMYITTTSVTGPVTSTLDVSNVTERAPKIAFLNNCAYPWTIQLSNNGNINSSQNNAATTKTLVIPPGGTAECWYSVGGGVLWVTGGLFMLGTNGPGNNRGLTLLTPAAPSLPADPWGFMFEFPGSNTAVVSTALPALSAGLAGKKMKFVNVSNYVCTLTGSISSTQGHPGTSLVMAPWSSVELDNDGATYTVTGGTYALSTEGYITISSANPSGGSNGDTWYQV